MLRWLGRNLSTLLLAFILAVVVWVSAVVAADPNQEGVYPRAIDLEIVGQDTAMLQTGRIPTQLRLTLNAPRSIWDELNQNPDLVRAWIDLSGLENGTYDVPVRVQIEISPVRIVDVDPKNVRVVLEPLVNRLYPVDIRVTGDPALGYRRGTPSLAPVEVNISGPESVVDQVVEVYVEKDVSGANETIRENLTVQAINEEGDIIDGITINPSTVQLTEPINLLGGYRNVAVKVLTTGEVAEGYWLTNINVNPPNVTVFSSNPQLVNQLPGFVETNPLDLTGLSDDVDIRANLSLPEGVSLAGEESVLVRLSIAAREGSLPISLPIEAVGLSPEYQATFSPDAVDVLLSGPLPILNNLNPAGIRVSVNLTGLEPGEYQVEPVVDLLPSQVNLAFIVPETIAVLIEVAPTSTPTSTIEVSSINSFQAEGAGTPLAATPEATPGLTPTP